MKGTVSLAHTYAAVLEKPGALNFWTLATLHDHVAYITDGTNTFAEAHQLLRKPMLYNGLGISQHFVKVHCIIYLTKVLESHKWIETATKPTKTPLKYNTKLLTIYTHIHD